MKLNSSRQHRSSILRYTCILFLILLSFRAFTQQTQNYTDLNKDYRDALDLYDKQKFVAASEIFSLIKKELAENTYFNQNENVNLLAINAEYYIAMCALELFNDQAEELCLEFIHKYPKNPKAVLAYFQIAKFYYRQENYPEALNWFKKVKEEDLSENEYIEYKFKSGYAYFLGNESDAAKQSFAAIKNLSNKYTYPAIYYYAYISFLQKDYANALSHFQLLKDSKTYEKIYPYYIAQIYYYTGRYNELIDYTKEVLSKDQTIHKAGFHNLIAKGYFHQHKYTDAIYAYEEFIALDSAHTVSEDDIYQLGYAYYQTEDYRNSIIQLEKLASQETTYGQYALLTLGDSFLQTGEKQSARNAFGKASRMTFDPYIRSIALLNYAKLSYELGFHQAAIQAFKEFIRLYPSDPQANEAKSLLGEVLLTTRNYKEALAVLEEIYPLNGNARLAYQKVTYYRGVELFNEKQLEDAILLFDKSLENTVDNTLQAMAHYWKAEALYALEEYDQAIRNYQFFTSNTQAAALPYYVTAYYNLGYAYLQKEDYATAAFYFDKFLKAQDTDDKLVTDAILRSADCNFAIRNYDKALYNYNKIISAKQTGTDYALFQKGMILGLQNRMNDKIVTLKSLLSAYPQSAYADDALYETANSQFILNNMQEALEDFNKLIRIFPVSSYVQKAKLNVALIYYNREENSKAMDAYKAIVKEYPASDESQQALQAIKNLYVEQGESEEYLAYVKSLPNAFISTGSEDSISFEAANTHFLKGDCLTSIQRFGQYLTKFPAGYFAPEAHFYRGECLLRQDDKENALKDFEFLLSKPGKFSERSLLYAARIHLEQKKPEQAIAYYKTIEASAEFKENYGEAIIVLMKAYMDMQDYAQAVVYADKVLKYEKSSAEDLNLAHLVLGKSYYAAGNTADAMKEFETIIGGTKTEPAAEARYLKALILFEQGDYLASQKACFELSNQIPSYDYWIARAFILLAENYAKLGNMFQAKSTLQSIIDEYDNEEDDIKPLARKKLEELEEPKEN